MAGFVFLGSSGLFLGFYISELLLCNKLFR